MTRFLEVRVRDKLGWIKRKFCMSRFCRIRSFALTPHVIARRERATARGRPYSKKSRLAKRRQARIGVHARTA